MKTNDKLLIATTAIYSYLFYDQNAGINFLLFNLTFMTILLWRDKDLLKRKNWLLAAAMCLFTSCCIVINSTALSIFANFCGLWLLSAFSFRTQTSTVASFLFSWYSVLTSPIQAAIDASNRSKQSTESSRSDHKGYRFVALLVVIVLGILFFVIYQQSNPLFAENTKWVNFNFISFGWVMFTIFSFFLLYGLFYHKTIALVDLWEQRLSKDNKTADPIKSAQHRIEYSSGILLFGLLNLMLIILNIGDINTIFFRGTLPAGISHSDFVHNGVELIILSIIIATGLIMFLFRFDFRNMQSSGYLRFLVYAWIVQNLLMLFSTAWRNHLYVQDYNLTYKRIGVYVWLCLAMIGLVLVFIKVRKERSNWFLVTSNFTAWVIFLAASSGINWDRAITRYNLQKPLKEVDFYYLFSLSEANIPELLEVMDRADFAEVDGPLRNFRNQEAYNPTVTYRTEMKHKVNAYIREYKSDWQSWDLRDIHNTSAILSH